MTLALFLLLMVWGRVFFFFPTLGQCRVLILVKILANICQAPKQGKERIDRKQVRVVNSYGSEVLHNQLPE